MSARLVRSIYCGFVLGVAGIGTAYTATSAEPKNESAVLAVDDAWGTAEEQGDAEFLNRLLDSGYRSIDAAGKVIGKEVIVESARKRGASGERAAKMAAWKAAHPVRGDVKIFGDTAVLTWVSLKAETIGAISSCDIFVYRDGHWRAIYSQHSQVSN